MAKKPFGKPRNPGEAWYTPFLKPWGLGDTGESVADQTSTPETQAPINRTAQSLVEGLDRGRAGVNQAYDKAIQARRDFGQQAIRQMMGGMASPGAATLAGSGAQGLLAGGGAQASARQAALQASQAANQFRAQTAMDVGQLLERKAVGELDYARRDAAAGAARFQAIADDIQQRKTMFSTASELVNYYRIQANRYPPGSPERQMYLNEIGVYQGTGKILT
tara:strand:- start:9006 stop:9668 length:663 start_codon:yes stop_codon:yes gene_type:complete